MSPCSKSYVLLWLVPRFIIKMLVRGEYIWKYDEMKCTYLIRGAP